MTDLLDKDECNKLALENVRAHMLCRPWYWFFFKRFIRLTYMTGFLRGYEIGKTK